MKKIQKKFPAIIVSIFIFITYFTFSCDDYKSEEFDISALDLNACNILQQDDSLGYDTLRTESLLTFDINIPVDTSIWVDTTLLVDTTLVDTTILVDTTLVLGWYESVIYAPGNGKYKSKYVPDILDSLEALDLITTNTVNQKVKIRPRDLEAADIIYISLQTNSTSLTFFFDVSISMNIIKENGEITRISDETMPLETAAGCTKFDENDLQVPYIRSRYKISVPENRVLLQLLLNEQTWPKDAKKEINLAIL